MVRVVCVASFTHAGLVYMALHWPLTEYRAKTDKRMAALPSDAVSSPGTLPVHCGEARRAHMPTIIAAIDPSKEEYTNMVQCARLGVAFEVSLPARASGVNRMAVMELPVAYVTLKAPEDVRRGWLAEHLALIIEPSATFLKKLSPKRKLEDTTTGGGLRQLFQGESRLAQRYKQPLQQKRCCTPRDSQTHAWQVL